MSQEKTFPLHPSVDNGLHPQDPTLKETALTCHCQTNPVTVHLTDNIAYNHICGCTKCWKPKGSLFSQLAVIPSNSLTVTQHVEKLAIVDKTALIKRYACKDCGVHMYGHVEDKDHAFFGLDFIHIELAPQKGFMPPQFAAFVSSLIQGGTNPQDMPAIREQIHAIPLETYDVLTPELMDMIITKRTQVAKTKG